MHEYLYLAAVAVFGLLVYWFIKRRNANSPVPDKLRHFPTREMRRLPKDWINQNKIVMTTIPTQPVTRTWQAADVMSRVNAVLDKYKIPGCLLQIKQHGITLQTSAVGTTYRRDMVPKNTLNKPITANMYFRIGSITKSMTATCILLLAQQKKLSLSDKLSCWPWGAKLMPKYASQISLLQMLNMTSGLGHYERDKTFGLIFDADPEIDWSPFDLVRWSNEAEVRPPGQSWDYCNTGYILSGLIIEQTTGMPLHGAFKKMLFEPLNMTHSYLAADSTLPQPHAQGFGNTRDKLENVTDWNPMWAWAAGGVVSTLDDMSKWASNLGNATLLKSQANSLGGYIGSSTTMLNASGLSTPSEEHKFNADYFYGLGVLYDHHWVWHNGSIPGWESIVAYHKPTGYSLVMNVNQSTLPDNHSPESPVTELFRRVVEVMTPDTPLHPVD